MWNWHDLCLIVRRKRFTFHIQLNYPNHTIEKQLKTFRHGVAPFHSAQHRKFYAHACEIRKANKPTSQQANRSTSQQVNKFSSLRVIEISRPKAIVLTSLTS